MKSVVVYYSHSGNTSAIAYEVLNILEEYGETDILQLQYSSESRSVLKRLFYRMMPSSVKLIPVPTDLNAYDVVCFGIPVVAGYPASAMTKYLSVCENLNKKKIICVYVYGIKLNAQKCARYIHTMLGKNAQITIADVYMPWGDARNKERCREILKEAVTRALPMQKDCKNGGEE